MKVLANITSKVMRDLKDIETDIDLECFVRKNRSFICDFDYYESKSNFLNAEYNFNNFNNSEIEFESGYFDLILSFEDIEKEYVKYQKQYLENAIDKDLEGIDLNYLPKKHIRAKEKYDEEQEEFRNEFEGELHRIFRQIENFIESNCINRCKELLKELHNLKDEYDYYADDGHELGNLEFFWLLVNYYESTYENATVYVLDNLLSNKYKTIICEIESAYYIDEDEKKRYKTVIKKYYRKIKLNQILN